MYFLFYDCSALTSLTTGTTFKFVGIDYSLPGTWQNTAGKTFTTGTFPSNVADTYTKVSSWRFWFELQKQKNSQNLQKKKEYGILYLSGRNSTDLPDHIIIFSFKFYNGGMVWCTLRLSSLTVSCACQASRSRGDPEGFPGTVVGAEMKRWHLVWMRTNHNASGKPSLEGCVGLRYQLRLVLQATYPWVCGILTCISCIKFLHDMCWRFWWIWVIFRTGSTQMAGSIPAVAFLGAWHPDLNLYLSLFGRTGGCNGCRFCFVKIRHIAYEKA